MIHDRESASDIISRALAITRYDIEHHQAINDFSLNIHGENFFRDLFNEVYGLDLVNANFYSTNAACIDLINKSNNLAYQITTTRTKEKIQNTLRALKKETYKNYTVKIFYLLEKAKPNKNTLEELKAEFSIEVNNFLFDYTDIIKDINDLDEDSLISICQKFFVPINEKYTNHIALDLVIKHLLKNRSKIKKDYDDSFGSVGTQEKIQLNGLNERISSHLNMAFDYRPLMESIDDEGDALSSIRLLIVDEIYHGILLELVTVHEKLGSRNYPVSELHALATKHKCDFNKILNKLYEQINEEIGINDYNGISITWIIISYFFELCDVGVQKK